MNSKRKLKQNTKFYQKTIEPYKKSKNIFFAGEIKPHDDQLYSPHDFGLGTRIYKLVGLLTHKGRIDDSGHYVAWVHKSRGKFDKNLR